MKLSKKLATISAAVLFTAAPVVASAMSTPAVLASTIHNTNGKNSKVKTTKSVYFVDKNGKKTKKKATKGGTYTIWNVQKIKGEYYFSIQTNLKYWLPATATKGSVKYGKTTITVKNGVVTVKTSSKNKQTTTTYDPANKSTAKKSTSKAKASKKTSSTKSVDLVTIKKTYVYDKKGKKAKTYMGSKKWTTLAKNVKLIGHGTKTINGTKYYALEPNYYYVKASAVKVR